MSHDDDATRGRIFGRREMLIAAAKAGIVLAAYDWLVPLIRAAGPAATQPAIDLVASPVLTEGPFFVDERLNRSDITTDTKRPSVVDGLPFIMSLNVYKLVDKKLAPLKDAMVDVWHTDALGVYSDENNPMNNEDTSSQKWLRGYQMTDKDGAVTFKTIFPGWYPGRTQHLHFKVRQLSAGGKATSEFTSQFFFRDEDADKIYAKAPYNTRGKRRMTNRNDGIYSERLADGSVAGERLTMKIAERPDKPGITTQYAIVLTEETMHGRGGRGGGPGGPGGPGGGPPRNRGGRPPGPPPDGDGPGGPPPN